MALLHSLSCMFSMATILLLIGFSHIAGVECIGVCYGRNGEHLPSATDTINFYKSNGIRALRVYDADTADVVLEALRGSNIDVILDVPNHSLPGLTDPNGARNWVQTKIVPYYQDVNFKYIAVGNEVYAKNSESQYVNYVLPALRNVHNALSEAGYQGRIKASTATYSAVLANTVPPNNSVFNADAAGLMNPIVGFLAQNNLPLLANIYPYFSYKDNPSIPQSFVLFTQSTANPDGYRNLFDALLDSMYAAVQKAGGPNIPIVVSESGWPSDGGFAATPQNAATYYRNLIGHVSGNSGTPMKPRTSIETYLFAMYDENLKRGDAVENHFGLFLPNKTPKYNLNFN
nr:glucan endo-1,3-beta-glucosidase, acidic-like [Ipomoea batatas]GMD72254.1 glucan endo-1,3-beta-glucosidase, acidic-like [Ipomoea batatas]